MLMKIIWGTICHSHTIDVLTFQQRSKTHKEGVKHACKYPPPLG